LEQPTNKPRSALKIFVGACAAKEVISDDISTRVTISIGLTVSRDEIDLSKIMRIADQALYITKDRGRNRLARADELSVPLAA
jgi:PleD family two-component response regulator